MKPGVEDIAVAVALVNVSADLKEFEISQLELTHQQDDFCELLELSLIFFGGSPPHGVTKDMRPFFEILTIPDSILEADPETWVTNTGYLQAEAVVNELHVFNNRVRSHADARIQCFVD